MSPVRAHFGVLGFAFALTGCATAADPCATLCDHAETSFSACLADNGETWGTSVGYTSEGDFANWCSTWVWEQEQLSDTGAACPAREAIVDDGTCADWYTAWGDTP